MKLRNIMLAIVSALVLQSASSGTANAVTLFEGNGYDFVVQTTDWNTARSSALGTSYMGVNGHLATISSQAENDFLYNLVASVITRPSGFAGSWLGGMNNQWVDGPEAGDNIAPASLNFTNWGGVEPNNFPNYVYMHIGDSVFAGIAPDRWVDSGSPFPSSGDPVMGYFVEFEGVAPVPLPAAFPLFAGGLGLLGLIGWRRKRMAAA